MVLDTTLFNTQHYKVRIKGKVEQSRERCSKETGKLGNQRTSGHISLRISGGEFDSH